MSFHHGDWEHDRLNAEEYENSKGDVCDIATVFSVALAKRVDADLVALARTGTGKRRRQAAGGGRSKTTSAAKPSRVRVRARKRR